MRFVRSLAAVKRLRSRLGLRCRYKRRLVRTTDGNHTLPIAPNLLEQKFNKTEAPNQIWELEPSLYGLLQVSSLTLFEKATLQELLQGASILKNNQPSGSYLNLFQF